MLPRLEKERSRSADLFMPNRSTIILFVQISASSALNLSLKHAF